MWRSDKNLAVKAHNSRHGVQNTRLVSTTEPLVNRTYTNLLQRHLYRRSLKLALDWAVHRYIWRGQAMYLRSLFEANKHITQPRQQRVRIQQDLAWWCRITNSICEQEIIEQTEDLLKKWKHPDPYRPPTAPGGSKYQRNLPVPQTDRMCPTYEDNTMEMLTLLLAPPMGHKELFVLPRYSPALRWHPLTIDNRHV